MKKVRIISDSTADVSAAARERIIRVPLTIQFGDTEYIDGVTMNHRQFYEHLVESDVLPTTSQPTPEAFADAYRDAIAAGEQVVVITVSSKLSGTYQSANIAAVHFEEDVFVVDSRTVAIGSGILTELALELADRGADAQTIVSVLEVERENVCVVALLDTLEYLKRGGRISKTAAFAGGLLNIKPVITIRDGEIALLGKARGSKQGNNLLVKEIEAAGGVEFHRPLLLGYTGLSDALLQKYVQDSAHLWAEAGTVPETTTISGVIGTHAGPGAIAVAFFKK